MNTLIGLLIIAIGSFGQSSSYVPINKVKNWSWESFWLVQGIFAWLVFPLLIGTYELLCPKLPIAIINNPISVFMIITFSDK